MVDANKIYHYLIQRNPSKNCLSENIDFVYGISKGFSALEKILRKRKYNLIVNELETQSRVFNIVKKELTPEEIESIQNAHYTIQYLSEESYQNYFKKIVNVGTNNAEAYNHIKESSLNIMM